MSTRNGDGLAQDPARTLRAALATMRHRRRLAARAALARIAATDFDGPIAIEDDTTEGGSHGRDVRGTGDEDARAQPSGGEGEGERPDDNERREDDDVGSTGSSGDVAGGGA